MRKAKTLFDQIPVAVVKQAVEELRRKQEQEQKTDDRNPDGRNPRVDSSLAALHPRQRPRCRTTI
jgi:hypothetical protein